MAGTPTKEQLEAAHCWEADDRVPRRPEMTEFRQGRRYHQAQWREANGHPIGSQPYAPRPNGPPARPVGSRLPLAYAKETGANLLTPNALAAARARTSFIEPHQSFDHQRLWADLLSSEALAFNLFGDLAADVEQADRAVHAWWPDAPGTVREVRFAHSPGRFDPAFLNSLRAFDVAVVLDVGDGTRAWSYSTPTTTSERSRRSRNRPISRATSRSPRSRASSSRERSTRSRGGLTSP